MSGEGILRHWTQDNTDLFTGGDLLYCGGCCGQHIAMKICNEHLLTGDNNALQVPGNTNNVPGSGCDAWIDCFVQQCQVCLLPLSNLRIILYTLCYVTLRYIKDIIIYHIISIVSYHIIIIIIILIVLTQIQYTMKI